MPQKSSAMKALRQTKKRTACNLAIKKAISKLRIQGRKAMAAKKFEEAQTLIPKLAQAVDKAAKRGAIKSNTANRIKSRYAKLLQTAR